MYTEIVMDHVMSPRNVGVLKDFNGKGVAGDPDCGDYLEMTIKISKIQNSELKTTTYIEDIKYLVHGCAGAIATSSMVSVLAKGKSIVDAYQLTDNHVIEALGGLPEEKIHCSLLGIVALRKAILNFAEQDH
ncbi:MAG: iron-sulfur cluster assembly scaffold protein [Clostridia bacterium]|nr:iron-sulfur cluster assembly scaffold protein [Clostridia bacterium]